jgi:MscS family membrane protein
MPLLRENRQGTSKSLEWIHTLGIALAIFLFVGSPARCPAQLSNSAAPPPSKAEPAAIVDPLGRETPRGTVMGLLKFGERQDFATAARYLQPTPGQDTDLVQRAKELQALHAKFKSNVGLLSDDPSGAVEAGLPLGEIWLVSKETIANIPKLYAQMENEGPTAANRILPAALTSRPLLGMSLAQWLGWLVSVPISWLLAWLLGLLLSAPRRVWYKLRKLPLTTIWETPLGMPLRCIFAILMHSLFVYLLEPPLLYRVYYFRFTAALLVGSLAWLVSRISDRGFHHAVQHTRAHRGGESILILMQRLTRVAMVIFVVVAALALFGLNVKTALAGLGIGGLAIALAAQKSLENLLGGVSLLMDKAVHVGDFCRIGDRVGTVEDIGLRSLKLRTLDQNLLVVPNGSLAQTQFENMRARTKLLINQNFSLRIETQVEQLRFVLDRVKGMLDEHPAIESGSSRVRVIGFAGSAFELELFAFGKTGDWTEFTAIRQDVILKIAEIVEAAGTRFAAPTRLTYLSRDAGLDAEKGNDIVGHVTELRATTGSDFQAKPESERNDRNLLRCTIELAGL